MLIKHLKRLTIDEIRQAPASPGLYAWYGTIVAGPPDWEQDLQGDKDQGEVNSRQLLRSHTSRYHGPKLEVQATGGFSTVWSGSIEDSSNQKLQEVLDSEQRWEDDPDDPDFYHPAPKLQQTLADPASRKLLFQALGVCTPVFASPLYIGIAKNLNARLGQHSRMMFKLWDVYSRDPAKFELVLQNQKFKGQFAVRAVQRGFSPETVEVWTFPLETINEDHLSREQLRVIAEALEWLLNRWHRPPLGRR
jgi:hypothetical protein